MSAARIDVDCRPAGEGWECRVSVADTGSQTDHDVVVTAADLEGLAPVVDAQRLVEESFRFLLEREPKESILRRFELPSIERYFPEYSAEIRDRLKARG